jgi:hypothetical protein
VNRSTRQTVEGIDRMVAALTDLRRLVPELERRNRLDAGNDGFPSASMGGGSTGGTIAKPTERAALSSHQADPVRKWTKDLLRALDRAEGEINTADNRRRLVFAGTEPPRELPRCQICGDESDELRRGRDPKCYRYWKRNGEDRAASLLA